MGQIVKTFLCVFLILFMSVTAAGILTAYMEVLNAQDMQARFVDELENSGYASAVVKDCFAQAARAGYELAFTFYYAGGGTSVCSSTSGVPWNLDGVTMARVELTFPFRVGLLGINQQNTFSGYAR